MHTVIICIRYCCIDILNGRIWWRNTLKAKHSWLWIMASSAAILSTLYISLFVIAHLYEVKAAEQHIFWRHSRQFVGWSGVQRALFKPCQFILSVNCWQSWLRSFNGSRLKCCSALALTLKLTSMLTLCWHYVDVDSALMLHCSDVDCAVTSHWQSGDVNVDIA